MVIPLALLHGLEFTALLRLFVDMEQGSPSVQVETLSTIVIQLQSLVLLYMAFCELLAMATLLECSLLQFQVQFIFSYSRLLHMLFLAVMNHFVIVYCLHAMQCRTGELQVVLGVELKHL